MGQAGNYSPRCQISLLYSAIVRSLEKKPALEILIRHLRRQPSGSQAYIPAIQPFPAAILYPGVQKKIAEILNEVLTEEQTTIVLLETMAGKGTEIGRTFEELGEIIHRVERKDLMGVCLDTCHVYDAGYDIKEDLPGVLAQFDRVLGLSRLRAVHLNDDKNEIGSHRDRHEKIGQGSLGKDVFARIINDKALKDLPFILETPNELAGFKEEIAMLKSWRND